MRLITPDKLYKHWAQGTKITIKGKKYRVGKMSYGDYFLEPGRERGETEGFNAGTLWLEKTHKINQYGIQQEFYMVIA